MLAEKLIKEHTLTKKEYVTLLDSYTPETMEQLRIEADRLRQMYYGDKVYTRGLIEFTNYCKNNCYYCGIRAGNAKAERYRLSEEEIMLSCEEGYGLGFRTFVLQGGEDPYYTDEKMAKIIRKIKTAYPDCAITLSIGEKSHETYKLFKAAGADRYLLRHETANEEHYQKLHPAPMCLSARKDCLYDLKALGYQVGAGFMVDSPYQSNECIADDLLFLKELEPQMVGIGPFLPHHDTEYADFYTDSSAISMGSSVKENRFHTDLFENISGEPEIFMGSSVKKTLLLLSIVRIILPKVLLPATTALGTADPRGREKGLSAGANVVMPNLSPVAVRKKYALYDDKICTGEEAAECKGCLSKRVESVGYRLVSERGDAV